VALAPVIGVVAAFIPRADSPTYVKPSPATDDLARSAQQNMAASDEMVANFRESNQVRQQASAAASGGNNTAAASLNAHSTDLLHRTRSAGTAPARRPRSTGTPPSDALLEEYAADAAQGQLLEEYALLWATLLTSPDSGEVAKARIAEIDSLDPQVMEQYLDVLMYAYSSVDLGKALARPLGSPGVDRARG
jgi:hypothetical protein